MKKWPSFNNFIITILVIIPILFNLYLLAPELNILSDVNDNVFAYALAFRMNEAWNEGNCPFNLTTCLPKLTDHWVSYWAMGYPLPHYYQHLPSIINVALFKALAGIGIVSNTTSALDTNAIITNSQQQVSSYNLPGLFIVFNWTKYLLLCFFPLAVYWSARKFRFPPLAAAFSALASTLISTNFQYGTDYGALLWRGSGMYTQLWGMFFLPLAVASIYDSIINWSKGYKFFAENSEAATKTVEKNKYLIADEYFQEKFSIQAQIPKIRIPHLFRSVILLALTFHSHILYGYIAVLSLIFLIPCFLIKYLIINKEETGINSEKINSKASIQRIIDVALNGIKLLTRPVIKLGVIFALSFLSLSYWIIPLFANNNYHAHSVWDELYKFNSFGFREIINRYFDGAIFDFGRFPIITILVFIGLFFALNSFFSLIDSKKQDLSDNNKPTSYLLFPLLLIFWTLMYFGRTTWGALIDLLPGSEGIHMHRFINGVHFAGIFLTGLGLYFIAEKSQSIIQKIVSLFPDIDLAEDFQQQNINQRIKMHQENLLKKPSIIIIFISFILIPLIILFPAVKERSLFLSENTKLLKNYNEEYKKDWSNFQKAAIQIKNMQQKKPGRIWAGRPGNWGRNFKVGGTEVFLALSVNGFDSLGFEPESWSLNTDIEQFFNDTRIDHYNLYNIRYVLAPPEQKFPDFVKKISSFGKYNVYSVETDGNFTFINSNMLIFGDKINTVNTNRFWLDSKWPEAKNHATISFDNSFLNSDYKINAKMIDLVSYKILPDIDKIPLSLLSQNPFSATQSAKINSGKVIREENRNDYYSSKIENSKDDLLMLKITYHPFWNATVNGKDIEKQMVSPYFIAVKTPSGISEVAFTYKASGYKNLLLLISLLSLLFTFVLDKKINNYRIDNK